MVRKPDGTVGPTPKLEASFRGQVVAFGPERMQKQSRIVAAIRRLKEANAVLADGIAHVQIRGNGVATVLCFTAEAQRYLLTENWHDDPIIGSAIPPEPFAILKGVSPSLTKETICESLGAVDAVWFTKSNHPEAHGVVRVEFKSEAEALAVLAGGSVLIDCYSIRTEAYHPKPRFHLCKRCCGLNHDADTCSKAPVCNRCSANHARDAPCTVLRHDVANYSCIHCKNAKIKGPHGHGSLFFRCPTLLKLKQSGPSTKHHNSRSRKSDDLPASSKSTPKQILARTSDTHAKASNNSVSTSRRL
jgi:hypothetical protein